VVVAALALVWSCGGAGAPGPTQPQTTLVITQWVKDPGVNNGPWPGYRPQISPIGQKMVTAVQAGPDNYGADWVVYVTFNAEGARLLRSLTKKAMAACPGDCAERHLAHWLDLTQDDVVHWNERASSEYRPVSAGGKLLSDTYVLYPIPTGNTLISANFSKQQATDLARRLGAS
jgi:preprotein translocase subunit SecD